MADASHGQKATSPSADAGRQHLLARVDKYDIAIPISAIVSIHEAPLVFSVPCAQPGIAGAIQFQGVAVPVFDLRRSLRLDPKSTIASDRLVLVDAGTQIMALIVDEVRECVMLQYGADEALSALFGSSPINAKIIAGIACAPALCAVLDPTRLLAPDEWDSDEIRAAYEQSADESNPLWTRTMALAETPKAPQRIGIEAALFHIAGQRFAVPLSAVLEFFTAASHTPMPLRSKVSVSLLNRRGEALMLFDPRPILGLPAAPLPPRVDGLVLEGEVCKMALPVDKAEGLSVLARDGASTKVGRFYLSVHPSQQGAILLLDVPAFLLEAQSACGGRTPAASAVA